MGTVFTFEVAEPGVSKERLKPVLDWLVWVDRTFSPYRAESQVSLLDRGEISLSQCCPEMRHVLEACAQLKSLSQGCFDAWAGRRFDPSGYVKGWAIERAAELLRHDGLRNILINGGGDVRTSGLNSHGRPWRVGVTDPSQRELLFVVNSSDGAVATSGTYERGHHVIDPRTGLPATALTSVTITGPDLAMADGLATAALVMGHEAQAWVDGLEGYEATALDDAGVTWETRNFRDQKALPGG